MEDPAKIVEELRDLKRRLLKAFDDAENLRLVIESVFVPQLIQLGETLRSLRRELIVVSDAFLVWWREHVRAELEEKKESDRQPSSKEFQ